MFLKHRAKLDAIYAAFMMGDLTISEYRRARQAVLNVIEGKAAF